MFGKLFVFFVSFGLTFAQFLTLRNGMLYSPSFMGRTTIVIGGHKITSVTPAPSQNQSDHFGHASLSNTNCDQLGIHYGIDIDLKGQIIIPGFVDIHVHAIGGGGEKGPASRTPESQPHELALGGVTTLVGTLGTDSVSRSIDSLLVKLYALSEYGLDTFLWIGGYTVPTKTITGGIQRDIVLIEKVLGVGELAISDHRSSYPSFNELVRITSDVRVAGMLSGKAAKVYVHMGSGNTMFNPLWEVINQTDIPIDQFVVTHVARNAQLLNAAKQWAIAGGLIDVTADEGNSTEAADAIEKLLQEGAPSDRISVSSDAYGSLPVFVDGKLVKYTYQKPNAMLLTLKTLVIEKGFPLQQVLPLFTKNPAAAIGMSAFKGVIKKGADADLIVLDNSFNIQYVISNGEIVVAPGNCVKYGFFPCSPL